jgi:probable rRNA maturation factor
MVNNIFDIDEVTKTVIHAVMDFEKCPYETQVNIVLTDDDGIRKINRETRKLDEATDVLSFPVLTFAMASDFSDIADDSMNFDPDSGELLLGDIIASADRIREQAAKYGHSIKREYAFLLTHSLLHLLGYDHLEKEEAGRMEQRQADILNQIGILRSEF